jgi:DNA-binding response OmpR family regulator
MIKTLAWVQTVFDRCRQAVIVTGAETDDLLDAPVLYANDSFYAECGCGVEEVLGKPSRTLLGAPEGAHLPRESVLQSMTQDRPVPAVWQEGLGREKGIQFAVWPLQDSTHENLVVFLRLSPNTSAENGFAGQPAGLLRDSPMTADLSGQPGPDLRRVPGPLRNAADGASPTATNGQLSGATKSASEMPDPVADSQGSGTAMAQPARSPSGLQDNRDSASHPSPLKILVVDDDPGIRRLLKFILEAEGYQVLLAASGREAIEAMHQGQPDSVILDIEMPGGNGLDFLVEMRKLSAAPVLMLSGHTEQDAKVSAFHLGADDFICKPFDEVELLARIRAHLRRTPAPHGSSRKRVRDLELDLVRHRVFRAGEEIRLTKKEFLILASLAEVPGAVLSAETLLEKAWGPQFVHYIQTLRVHIGNLRQKIERDLSSPGYIQTVSGVGYRLLE